MVERPLCVDCDRPKQTKGGKPIKGNDPIACPLHPDKVKTQKDCLGVRKGRLRV